MSLYDEHADDGRAEFELSSCPRCGKEQDQPFHTCSSQRANKSETPPRWIEEHWEAKKQQWLNSVTLVCADFSNVAAYIKQVEKDRDAWKECCRKLAKSAKHIGWIGCEYEETIREAEQTLAEFDRLNAGPAPLP